MKGIQIAIQIERVPSASFFDRSREGSRDFIYTGTYITCKVEDYAHDRRDARFRELCALPWLRGRSLKGEAYTFHQYSITIGDDDAYNR